MTLGPGDTSDFSDEEPQSMRNRISDPEDADGDTADSVGYGRPPRHTRFKPGQSGNPNGRAKGRKSWTTMILEVLDERLSIREGDKTRTVSKAEGMIRAIVIKALKGDPKAFQMLSALLEKIYQEQKQQSAPRRVVRMPAEVKDVDEWFERYAPKHIVEARLKAKESGSDPVSDTSSGQP